MVLSLLPIASASARDIAVHRIAGPTRLETAVEVSQAVHPADGTAAVVVLARADDPADAFAATTYASDRGGVVLLTGQSAVPDPTMQELRRVLVPGGRVVLAGGTAVITDDVVTQLQTSGVGTIERIAGATRYDTAVAFADAMGADVDDVLLVDGDDYRMALPAAAAAGSIGGVAVLTAGEELPDGTAAFLEARLPDSRLYVAGRAAHRAVQDAGIAFDGSSPSANPSQVASDLADLVAGRTGQTTAFTLASAGTFPDALTGGVHAAAERAPLLLLGDDLDPVLTTAIRRYPVSAFTVLGGAAAVSDEVLDEAIVTAGGKPLTPPPPPPPPPSPPDPDAVRMEQARALADHRQFAYDSCAPRPESPLIPADATCVTVFKTDLDGDGLSADRLDPVIMYHDGTGESVTVAGFSTALGTLAPYTTAAWVPWPDEDGTARSGYATECIASVDTDPAVEIFVTTSVGANTIIGFIADVRDGAIRPVVESGVELTWSWGGGVRFGSGYRISSPNVILTSYDDGTGSPYGWAESHFRIEGGVARLTGSRSGSTADLSPYGTSGCPGGTGTFAPGP